MSDLAAALDVVGPRWALLIVGRLLEGPQRYGDLQRDLGVPTNMLATRLRELEAAGVLTRLPLRHNTRAYALTDRGLALREAIVRRPRRVSPPFGQIAAFADAMSPGIMDRVRNEAFQLFQDSAAARGETSKEPEEVSVQGRVFAEVTRGVHW